MHKTMFWAAVVGSATAMATLTAGCGSDATTAAAADAAVSDSKVADSTSKDGVATDTVAGDVAKADSKTDTFTPSCAQAAGAWAVTGTCSNGASSIPFACMKAKGCTLTWEADFREWTGTLAGADYHLTNAAGSENIDGHFKSADMGSYTFSTKGLTCDATMDRFSSDLSDQLCCDVVAQDCQGAGKVCVPMLDTGSGAEIVTTGCLDVAGDATTTAGATCNGNGLPLTCGKGLLCVKPTGAGGSGQGACAKLCANAGDCGTSQSCVIASGAPKSGVCEAGCTPLASKDGCGDGQFCGPAALSDSSGQRVMGGACAVGGTVKAGEKCSGSGQCQVGAICASGACAALCDNAHPCPTGTCTGFGLTLAGSAPAGFGYCAP